MDKKVKQGTDYVLELPISLVGTTAGTFVDHVCATGVSNQDYPDQSGILSVGTIGHCIDEIYD